MKTNISPFSYPKLGEDQNKKKGFHSNLVRFLAENWVKAKKRSSSTICVLKPSAKVTKGGGSMSQFCVLFYANSTILATQRGGHGPMPPLNTPFRTQQRIASSRIKPIVSNWSLTRSSTNWAVNYWVTAVSRLHFCSLQGMEQCIHCNTFRCLH